MSLTPEQREVAIRRILQAREWTAAGHDAEPGRYRAMLVEMRRLEHASDEELREELFSISGGPGNTPD